MHGFASFGTGSPPNAEITAILAIFGEVSKAGRGDVAAYHSHAHDVFTTTP
jgi:hypothetical protein